MDTKSTSTNYKEIIKLISTILSWTIFVLLAICAVLLIYYFIATKIYELKGSSYEPEFSLYTIVSPSMTPNINVYDVIVDLKVDDPKDIKIGDVITFVSSSNETNGMIITHRVVSVIKDEFGKYSYQTKGDHNPIEDSGRVSFESIIGRVAFRLPGLGRIQSMFSSSTGLILILLAVSLFIILKGLIKKLIALNPEGKMAKIFSKPLRLPFQKHLALPEKIEIVDENTTLNNDTSDIAQKMEQIIAHETQEKDMAMPELKSKNKEKNPMPVEEAVGKNKTSDEEEIDLPELK